MYIGNTATQQAFTPAVDFFSGNASTTAFTLSRPVASVAQVEAVIENVVQNPGSAYTVSGNTITFTSAPPSGSNNIYVRYTSPITQVAALPQSPVVFGNLQMSSAGGNITGDFTNATLLNRNAFQTITTNGSTGIYALPNGTSTAASWQATNAADPTNASKILIATNGSTDVQLVSGINGTGTYLPLTFYTNGAEKMRLDTAGNLGINTSSPNISGQSASVKVVSVSGTGNNWGGLELNNPSASGGSLLGFIGWTGSNMTTGYNMPAYIGTWLASGTANKQGGELRFFTQSDNTAGATERARIDSSGNLLVGNTTALSNPASGFCFNAPTTASYGAIGHVSGTTSGAGYFYFSYNAGFIGSITQNGTTGVLYNLTSDYRLKNDQQPLTGAKDFIMALKPKKWQWWDGSGEGVGFIAHEFMEVAKYSGHGEKDAVDADGKPIYQSIQPSSSEVMANLVALIQEQQALITELTNRITALENK
jgi:hypothetical protein